MKPENKAARQAMKKAKEPSLHPWQKKQSGFVYRKTPRAYQYETFSDDIFIGYTYVKGGSR
jgi:hypothetical protein